MTDWMTEPSDRDIKELTTVGESNRKEDIWKYFQRTKSTCSAG